MKKPSEARYELKRGCILIISPFVNAGHTTDNSDYKKHIEFVLKDAPEQINGCTMDLKTVRRIIAKLNRIASWMAAKG